MAKLIATATSKGVEYDPEGYALSKEFLRDQLTSIIAQRLYSVSDGYRLLNPRRNLYYKRALEILANWQQEALSLLNLAN
jgi:hypothetical protein